MMVIEKLVELFSRFPGIGKKSAARMVYAILKKDEEFATQLAQNILNVRRNTICCSQCGAYTEQNECSICSDLHREKKLLCVVEQPQDIFVLETAHVFHGLYHVLGGVIDPMNGIGPEDLSVDRLIQRVTDLAVEEVILATNPTLAGDTTALFVQQSLPTYVKVSRIALGMPIGGNLEYTDKQTLARSLDSRTAMQ